MIIIIYNLVEGIFFSKIVCEKDGVVEEIDARTSDAIAMAVRFDSPVYTYEFILSSAGILLDEEEEGEEGKEEKEVSLSRPQPNDLAQHSISRLEELLNSAILDEDYEKASRIRDEINSRKTN